MKTNGMRTGILTLCGLLALGTPSQGSLLLYEGLGYGATDVAISGQGGDELGFTSSEKWAGTATYKPAGLTFSDVIVSGGSLYITHGNSPSRGLNISPSGDIFGGFLINYDDLAASGQGSVCFTDAPTLYAVGLRFRPTLTGAKASITDPAGVSTSPAHAGYTLDTTYLTLFKVTDVAGTGSHTFKMWVLSAGQFDNFKAGGLTETELDGATVGTGTANVMARVSCTYSGDIQFESDDYLCHRVANDSGTTRIYFDEYRLGTTLEDVAPAPPPPSGVLITLR